MAVVSLNRNVVAALAAVLLGAPAVAQKHVPLGPAAGAYEFVPSESESVDEKVDRAVAHMNFLIRPFAARRLRGANRPIERIEIRYPGDTVWVSLRPDEPPIRTPRDGTPTDYRRADGEVVRVRTELSPGVIDQFFDSEDGDKRMVYRMRPDGLLALDVEVLSDKLNEPFLYTWVFRPVPPEGGQT
ncbi:MAG: hypothetical protein KY466_12640 [Gemmatimonadetes bacterium]|nr:hypothetical protein [Gemmatimonadota bacterium]